MNRRTMFIGLAALAAVISTVGWIAAQSGTRPSGRPPTGTPQRGTTQGSDQRSELPFEERFWNFLQQAQYRNWGPLPGQTDDVYPGNSPHGEKVKLYANRPAAGRPAELPHGSILVKENYDSTGEKLMSITVMYRSKGYAPDSGDWYWTKYEPDGKVSTMRGMRITGRVSMCVECHKSAGGGDYVFANDPR
jgi:hypothetical protein